MKSFKPKLFVLLVLFPVYASAWDRNNTSYVNSSSYAGAHVNSQTNSNSVSQSSTGNVTVKQKYDDQAPAVSAPAVMTSAPCFVGYSGGVSVAGFGVSGGTGTEDKNCTLRETSRILYSIGERNAAVRVMCTDPIAAAALGTEKCPQQNQ